jgi:glycosyltransferase involved in cell wall biosynthesis
MSSAPLVSVLMPAYNAEKFIAAAINSILNQDYLNWELLILDDASTDKTAEIIGGFSDSRIKVFHHSENQGYLLSCNELFKKAEGDFITFLDADDLCAGNRLSLCLREFENNPELGFLTTDHQRISESGSIISVNSVDVDYERYSRDPNYNPTICCATIFLRRSLLLKVGVYRDFFKDIGGEDYFWLWELSQNGTGMHLKLKLYDYRQHQHQTSKNHGNELSLFLPELIAQLKTEVSNGQWSKISSAKVLKTVSVSYVNSPFEVSLRKAQKSLNVKDDSFWNYVHRSFLNVSNLKQLVAFLNLLYSWMARKGRNAIQSF